MFLRFLDFVNANINIIIFYFNNNIYVLCILYDLWRFIFKAISICISKSHLWIFDIYVCDMSTTTRWMC